VTLTISEALTGFSRVVLTHLDGRGISLTVPPGKVVNHGQSFRIKGEGMPKDSGRSPEKGDLWIRCEIEKVSPCCRRSKCFARED
jgi:DnaJ family protein A protein 2